MCIILFTIVGILCFFFVVCTCCWTQCDTSSPLSFYGNHLVSCHILNPLPVVYLLPSLLLIWCVCQFISTGFISTRVREITARIEDDCLRPYIICLSQVSFSGQCSVPNMSTT